MKSRIHLSSYILFMLSLLLFIATACTSMTCDDDYSVIPCVNNPSITGNSGQSWVPSVGF